MFFDRSGSCRELRSALQQVAAWDRNAVKTEIKGQKRLENNTCSQFSREFMMNDL